MQRYIPKVNYIVGCEVGQEKLLPKRAYPLPIYEDRVCEFVGALSQRLRLDKYAKKYADIQTFAFWCRRSNLKTLKEQRKSEIRIGRGKIFHITPSNVPVNFAFSLVFGLLAGNANVVRVSTKGFPQVEIICRVIKELLGSGYEDFESMISVISYERDREITDLYSANCDGRIIWGGDSTIEEIEKSKLPPRSVDIHFADRFSFGVIASKKILSMNDQELLVLAEKFYIDTYLMDQNACSTPHLLLWKVEESQNEEELSHLKDRLYQAIYKVAKRYELSAIKASEKYTALCEIAAEQKDLKRVRKYENLLYIVELQRLPDSLDKLKGKYGSFFTYDIKCLDEVASLISTKVQTCLYCGVEKQEVLDFILNNHIGGIDRIVPFGESLDITVNWDGYDIIGELSRVIV